MASFIQILAIVLAVLLGLGPILGAIAWEVWSGTIRPALIPRSEIDHLVREVLMRSPARPIEAAAIEEGYYWHRSDSFQQGKWRRVRREIERRINAPS